MRVLVADDDPILRRLLHVSLLKSGYEPIVVGDGAEVLQVLAGKDSPRLIVLDWMMPHVDGVEVCRAVRETVSEHYTYLILLTARGKQAEIVEGLEAGADDYITKPFDIHEFNARLRVGIRILDLEDRLVTQAATDSLTGFLNRKAIFEVLHKEVVRATRERDSLSVIMADLDNFKTINDTHGHAVGDAVLKETAKRILGSLRNYDSVGRYGGEEFVIIAPGCDAAQGAQLADRLRKSIGEVPVEVSGRSIPITMSLGVTDIASGQKSHGLVRSADEALYLAKSKGRNRVEVKADFKLVAS